MSIGPYGRDYHGAHTAFLLFVFAMSAWNGASFYFNYFAKCVPSFILARGLPTFSN